MDKELPPIELTITVDARPLLQGLKAAGAVLSNAVDPGFMDDMRLWWPEMRELP